MRVTVGMIVGQIGAGHSIEEVLADLPLSGARGRSAGATLRSLACWRAGSAFAPCMKLLVDMNLSPQWIPLLRDAGWYDGAKRDFSLRRPTLSREW